MTKDRLVLHACSNEEAGLIDILERNQCVAPSSRRAPLDNIVSYVESLGCAAVVIQKPVQDPDFFAEYVAYYSRTFSSVSRHCQRLHFFSLAPSEEESVLSFLDRASQSSESYLGFITIRPVLASPVAASILKMPAEECFIVCRDIFDVHLAGLTFQVKGTPFMQQDNAVGACAQASIWMALRTVRRREGSSAYDPAEITNAATRFLVNGRTLPNRTGLTPSQMIEAVRFAGYATHIIPFRESQEPLNQARLRAIKSTLHTYIESGIPVILALFPGVEEGHAVVAIGHGWDPAPAAYYCESIQLAASKSVELVSASSWIDCLYVNNDNTGPYIRLEDQSDHAYSLSQIYFAIPLLPSDVFINGEEANVISREILADILIKLHNSGVPVEEISGKIAIRTMLSERHKFREWALNSNLSLFLKEYYRLKVMPKKVWVAELTLCELYHGADDHREMRVGEVIIDSTGDPAESPFIAVHINTRLLFQTKYSLLIDKDREGRIEIIPIEEDRAYERVH